MDSHPGWGIPQLGDAAAGQGIGLGVSIRALLIPEGHPGTPNLSQDLQGKGLELFEGLKTSKGCFLSLIWVPLGHPPAGT